MRFRGVKDLEFQAILRKYHKDICELLIIKYPEALNNHKLDLNKVQVVLSNKMTRAIGKANFRKNVITLSYPLIKKYPNELTLTYGHELCHLVAMALFHDRGHKRGWKAAMIAIGLPPERCHTLDVTEFKRKVQRHIYTCGCPDQPEIRITTVAHKNIQSKRSVYRCRKCKEVISPERFIRSELK